MKIVKLLLKNGANSELLFEGKSALEHAIANDQHEVAELLKVANA